MSKQNNGYSSRDSESDVFRSEPERRSSEHSSGEHREHHSSSGEHREHHSSSGEHREHHSSSGEYREHHSSSGEHHEHRSSSGEHHEHHSSDSRSSSSRSGSSSSSRSGSSSSSRSGSSSSSRSGSPSSSRSGSSSSSSGSHRHSSSSSDGSRHHRYYDDPSTPKEPDNLEKFLSKYQVIADDTPKDDELSTRKHKHKHRHRHRHKFRKSSKPVKKVLLVLLIFLLVVIIAFLGSFVFLIFKGHSNIKKRSGAGISRNKYSVTYDEGKTVVYNGTKYALNEDLVSAVFMGVDKDVLGVDDNSIGMAGQADTIMIFTYDLKTSETKILTVPRDSMVDINLATVTGTFVDTETKQICLAYSYGNGRNTSCENVMRSLGRLLYDVPIDYYASLDLEGIEYLTDAIGGVTLVSLETFDDFFTEGQQVALNGKLAHRYVRYRDTYNLNSDSFRRERQMQFLKAFIKKAVKAALKDFGVVSSLYNTATTYSTTNVELSTVTYLATKFISTGGTIGETYTVPGEMVEAEPYAEYHVDEVGTLETVLNVFYVPIGPAE
ncbi:MAG: LCP family protein [Clostridiales bacterium]|nr:LCP family protein [Clostridiales bacterium]